MGPATAGVGADGSTNIPADHPRAASLRVREAMKDAVARGLVHPTGLIAHGRGEAMDYLLGERTPPEALEAIDEAARLLWAARRPVLSLNGNVVALAAAQVVEVALARPGLRLEVNLFHRTEERVRRLVEAVEAAALGAGHPEMRVLGRDADFRIPGLTSDRALTSRAGIGEADVVLVPLEDGDRCGAIKAMGKTVITIDLNPLSRTAKAADVTIVDELTRALPLLAAALRRLNDREAARNTPAIGPAGAPRSGFDNDDVLRRVRVRMAQHLQSP